MMRIGDASLDGKYVGQSVVVKPNPLAGNGANGEKTQARTPVNPLRYSHYYVQQEHTARPIARWNNKLARSNLREAGEK